MCDHEQIVRLADGWYCPDCKQHFDEKPTPRVKITFLNVEEKDGVEAKPEKKKTTKKAVKKND